MTDSSENTSVETVEYVAPIPPKLGKVAWSDIRTALGAGWRDFMRAPLYGLFFGAVFAASGLAIVAFLAIYNVPWMILPIMIGFPLVGPFVATGLYEVSRKLAAKEPLSWRAVLMSVFRQRERQMGWMAFVILFVFWVWVYLIRVLIALFMGFNTPSTLIGFINAVVTSQSGLTFLIVGTLIGAVLALFLFSATVFAMPMLLDTELDFVTAVIVSIRGVTASPVPMLGWGIIVTLVSIVAMAPAFLGLLLALPILGHATWHLYANAKCAGAESD